ncbi:putative 3-demethylubiquinone-9 3-methyltransferase (glyoxalase superfamily) [Geodermatophilus normandii]|uniref:Putative 3-demethylubiquinone-9 3-methyltransferase (Glyoxalase superfamily) n=1 Tax=Geodermatophilus normandii TaxID=1137989 RepID=A0A317QPA6_9ACTN|nr:VOC family protein [Geodermatophilus normandii]PWW24707.1 putative 3-demethylubiquinone-9 3-methyltransferase (glyoxalase superfamily) [Geodermatophilus normandii]
MPKQIPCLWFDTEAEEAARFYTSIWPDAEVLGTVRYGAEDPAREGQALTVSWRLGDTEYVGLNGGPQDWSFSEAISFQVLCADQEEVDHYWDRLTDGGQEAPCGWLKDRFGVSWQVVPTRLLELQADPDPDRRQRAVQEMFTMRKIVIADLERAADSVSA